MTLTPNMHMKLLKTSAIAGIALFLQMKFMKVLLSLGNGVGGSGEMEAVEVS